MFVNFSLKHSLFVQDPNLICSVTFVLTVNNESLVVLGDTLILLIKPIIPITISFHVGPYLLLLVPTMIHTSALSGLFSHPNTAK